MTDHAFHVAIVGAGLSGLALALALHEQSISCTIYEANDAPRNIGGALMLTPNGLNVLKRLHLDTATRKEGYHFDRIYFQDADSGTITETVEYGGQERFGSSALRIYRSAILQVLLDQVQSKVIPVRYHHKLSRVTQETEEKVTFEFTNGSIATGSLLIGADGIHSTVRRYIAPDVEPQFICMAAIIGAVPTSQLDLPAGDRASLNAPTCQHPLPVVISQPQKGAFVIAPQSSSGDEVMITVQRRMEPREQWAALEADKDALRSLLRTNTETFPPIVKNAVSDIPDKGLYIWPFYQVPRLDHWVSSYSTGQGGRVIIVGDAAHALSPTTGQGANQALEDVYLLARVLGEVHTLLCANGGAQQGNTRLRDALQAWQLARQSSINQVLALNRQMDLRRAPVLQEGEKDGGEVKVSMKEGFDRLFTTDLDAIVRRCVA